MIISSTITGEACIVRFLDWLSVSVQYWILPTAQNKVWLLSVHTPSKDWCSKPKAHSLLDNPQFEDLHRQNKGWNGQLWSIKKQWFTEWWNNQIQQVHKWRYHQQVGGLCYSYEAVLSSKAHLSNASCVSSPSWASIPGLLAHARNWPPLPISLTCCTTPKRWLFIPAGGQYRGVHWGVNWRNSTWSRSLKRTM